MNLAFSKFQLCNGSKIELLSSSKKPFGPVFTSSENNEDFELWTHVVPGDEIWIRMHCLTAQKDQICKSIEVGQVNVGHQPFSMFHGSGGTPTTEDCHIDVRCEISEGWEREIPSVAKYTIEGTSLCSGAMINNELHDLDPLFISAEHCGVDTINDRSVVTYWNFENSYCRPQGTEENASEGDGAEVLAIPGSEFLVSDLETDLLLLRLSEPPSTCWGVTWSGWTRSASGAGGGSSIHHPRGAEKRISFPSNVTQTTTPNPGAPEVDLKAWSVRWDNGTVEPGSSGSPLFNSQNRIIGTLCCGPASGTDLCLEDSGYFYGRIFRQSWESVSPYLDPLNTNIQNTNTLVPIACCLDDQPCQIIDFDECLTMGGSVAGLCCSSTFCDSEPSITGCCFSDGSCEEFTQTECSIFGGQSIIDLCSDQEGNTSCEINSVGCCFPLTGNCQELSKQDCLRSGGQVEGDLSCDAIECDSQPFFASCCLSNGQCVPSIPLDECLNLGGEFVIGLGCVAIDCDEGACCLSNGGCVKSSQAACSLIYQGTYLGNLTNCINGQCLLTACCLPNGDCIIAEPLECLSTFLGIPEDPGTLCQQTECDEGACCLPGDECLFLGEDLCNSAGGKHYSNEICSQVSCTPACPEDLNGDGSIRYEDLVLILSSWGPCVGCSEDLDQNGAIDYQDLVRVLSMWGPCP